jgi:hypothetical protein
MKVNSRSRKRKATQLKSDVTKLENEVGIVVQFHSQAERMLMKKGIRKGKLPWN